MSVFPQEIICVVICFVSARIIPLQGPRKKHITSVGQHPPLPKVPTSPKPCLLPAKPRAGGGLLTLLVSRTRMARYLVCRVDGNNLGGRVPCGNADGPHPT